MANPPNDAEVENVLSAIRRLIAEGRPEGQGTAPLGPLVLTPALRVAEPLALLDALPGTAPAPRHEAPDVADRLILVNALPDVGISSVLPAPEETEGSEPVEARRDEAEEPAGAEPPPEAPLLAGAEPLPEAAALAEDESHPRAAPRPEDVALRALVAEVLREELRGELGASLLRDLRELLRREGP